MLRLTKAGSFLSTTTCVTTEATFFSIPSSKRAFCKAFCSQKPILPSVIATRESSGKAGFFSESAANCCSSKFPTCGPFPWVMIRSSPFLINFTKCLAVSTKASCCAFADGSDERMAFPPKATTILRFAIKFSLNALQ